MTVEDSMVYQSHNQEILIESKDLYSDYLAVFDDNGRVAYGYLIKNSNIVADVWLYNHGLPPDQPEWKNPSMLPFANPKEFASAFKISPVESIHDVSFSWEYDEQHKFISLKILIREEVYGLLKPDSRVGWSKLAIKDGPLAKCLVFKES